LLRQGFRAIQPSLADVAARQSRTSLRKGQEPEPGQKNVPGTPGKAASAHGYHESREESQIQTSACQASHERAGLVCTPGQEIQVSK
ncbi:hypothetical protein P7K49_035886, partial [Saguinus oedipus]